MWRSDVEAMLGHRVTDWPAWERATYGLCDDDRKTFGQDIADSLDQSIMLDPPPVLEAIRVSVSYACPQREPEVPATVTDATAGR